MREIRAMRHNNQLNTQVSAGSSLTETQGLGIRLTPLALVLSSASGPANE
jgi:hypothetical protein